MPPKKFLVTEIMTDIRLQLRPRYAVYRRFGTKFRYHFLDLVKTNLPSSTRKRHLGNTRGYQLLKDCKLHYEVTQLCSSALRNVRTA